MTGDADRLYDDGLQAFRAGDAERSRRCNEESLGLATAAGDARAEARALIGLARLAFRAANYEEVRQLSARSAERAADVGDEETEIMALHMRAEAARAERDFAAAVPLYEQSLERRRAIGDEGGVTMELYNLGAVLAAGEPAQARALLAEALERAQDEDADWLVAYCLGALGAAAAEADPHGALRLIGAADAEFERRGEVLDPAERLERQAALDRIRKSLDPAAIEAELARGRATTLERAVDEALDARA